MHTCVHANFRALGFYGMFLGLHLLAFRSTTYKPFRISPRLMSVGLWVEERLKQRQLAANCSMSCTVPVLSGDSIQLIAECRVVCQC